MSRGATSRMLQTEEKTLQVIVWDRGRVPAAFATPGHRAAAATHADVGCWIMLDHKCVRFLSFCPEMPTFGSRPTSSGTPWPSQDPHVYCPSLLVPLEEGLSLRHASGHVIQSRGNFTTHSWFVRF